LTPFNPEPSFANAQEPGNENRQEHAMNEPTPSVPKAAAHYDAKKAGRLGGWANIGKFRASIKRASGT
jgi:hypothetical protein